MNSFQQHLRRLAHDNPISAAGSRCSAAGITGQLDVILPGSTYTKKSATFVWFLAKIVFVFFMFAMVKAFVPRYRYNQLMRLGWKVFLPLSLAMVVGWRVCSTSSNSRPRNSHGCRTGNRIALP